MPQGQASALLSAHCAARLGGGSADLPLIASVIESRCSLLSETPAFYRKSVDLELGQWYVITLSIGGLTDPNRKTCETRADEFDPVPPAGVEGGGSCVASFLSLNAAFLPLASIREARGNERRRKGRTAARDEGMKVFISKS